MGEGGLLAPELQDGWSGRCSRMGEAAVNLGLRGESDGAKFSGDKFSGPGLNFF